MKVKLCGPCAELALRAETEGKLGHYVCAFCAAAMEPKMKALGVLTGLVTKVEWNNKRIESSEGTVGIVRGDPPGWVTVDTGGDEVRFPWQPWMDAETVFLTPIRITFEAANDE